MHGRGNQFDPRIDMYALMAAAKTEAKREAERTRRKLLNAASALAGEYDDATDCVVTLAGNGEGEEHSSAQDNESQSEQKQKQQLEGSKGEDAFSDWA
jgi:hypothetical protein